MTHLNRLRSRFGHIGTSRGVQSYSMEAGIMIISGVGLCLTSVLHEYRKTRGRILSLGIACIVLGCLFAALS